MTSEKPDLYPEGVELRDFEDTDALRENIFKEVQAGFEGAFPKTYGNVILELKDVKYDDQNHISLKRQQDALMNDKFLHRRLRGTLVLKDKNTGQTLETKKNHTLVRVPWLTPRGTVIHNGNEYSLANQSRLEPGIYSRRKNNGDIEAHVNAQPGKGGRGFRIRLEPQTGQFKMDIGQSTSLHLFSFLRDMGYSEEKLRKSWGDQLFEKNAAKYDTRVLNKAFQHLSRGKPDIDVTLEEKLAAIRETLNNTRVRRDTLAQTLHRHYS